MNLRLSQDDVRYSSIGSRLSRFIAEIFRLAFTLLGGVVVFAIVFLVLDKLFRITLLGLIVGGAVGIFAAYSLGDRIETWFNLDDLNLAAKSKQSRSAQRRLSTAQAASRNYQSDAATKINEIVNSPAYKEAQERENALREKDLQDGQAFMEELFRQATSN